MGKLYEVGLNFAGNRVDVIYDPADVRELTIEYEGYEPWTAHPLTIGERAGQIPGLPEHMGTIPAQGSRLLEAARQQRDKRQAEQLPAVSYRRVDKGETDHV